MVNNELDFYLLNINPSSLEEALEQINPAYAESKYIYNQLQNPNERFNPLLNNGLAAQKTNFLIILLEKILRNTSTILNQNQILENRIIQLEKEIFDIRGQTLEPIVVVGNKITEELKLWETGFSGWNSKFENFENLFNIWNTGFKNFETKFNNLERQLDNFLKFWDKNLTKIETNLSKIEQKLLQWDQEISIVKERLEIIGQELYKLPTPSITTPIVTNNPVVLPKQTFQKKPSNNHKFTF